MNPDVAEYPCTNCIERLGPIHIVCAKCTDLRLCIECFACGAEFSGHERTHPYRVINTGGKCVFNENTHNYEPWRSAEEIALLEAVERFNLGNWDDVVEAVGSSSRNAKELRDHYDKFFLRGKIGQITRRNLYPPSVRDHTTSNFYDRTVENDIAVKVNSDDLTMLAYMPNRGDFEKEYNNDAENLIANLIMIHDDDEELDKNLKLAQIDAYVRQLCERKRRRDLIQNYALIEQFFKQERPQQFSGRYTPQAALRLKREREFRESLKKFTQLLSASDFNDLISSLIKEKFLKDRIERLQHLQKRGVTSQRDGGDHFDADQVLGQPEAEVEKEKASRQMSQLKSEEKVASDSLSTHPGTYAVGNICDAVRNDSQQLTAMDKRPAAAMVVDSSLMGTRSDLSNNNHCGTNVTNACELASEIGSDSHLSAVQVGSSVSLPQSVHYGTHLLSESEYELCRTLSLGQHEYILLKASLIKEQTLKWASVPLRKAEENSLKDEVKDFLIMAGWLPTYG